MTDKGITGIGIGSASLVLIFIVLCLAFFSLISYTSANNDLLLARAQADAVTAYYEADAQAERILTELSAKTEKRPVEEIIVPVSDDKELYIKLILENENYTVAAWHIRETGFWIPDMNLPVWQGD